MLVKPTATFIRGLRAGKTETFSYKTINGIQLPMKLYFPDGHNAEDARGAIVCIHGGSWRGVDDNSPWDGGIMAPHAEYYAARGAVGITISYRDFLPPEIMREPGKEYTTLYDLHKDCRDAICYIKRNARRFGIDANRIAVIGDSAGGHLAACLATIGNDDEEGRIAAAVACNPITDLTDPAWYKYIECVNCEDAQNEAKRISPLYRVSRGCVPMLVMHGTDDTCVLPRHSFDFYERSCALGNHCEIRMFPGAAHAFIIFDYTATDEQIENAMKAADDFFEGEGIF